MNGTLTDEQFAFSMTAASGNPTEGLDTQTKFRTSANNDAQGKVDFGKQKFTKTGVWKYFDATIPADYSNTKVGEVVENNYVSLEKNRMNFNIFLT